MALINCPYCGEQISEKATTCVHCGKALTNNATSEKACPECGTILREEDNVCPKCGCPIEASTAENLESVGELDSSVKKNGKITVIVVALVIIALIVGIFGYKHYETEKNVQEYADNYAVALDLMLDGVTKSEELGVLINSVWYNSIYQESDSATDKYTKDAKGVFYDDFNIALGNIINGYYYYDYCDNISQNQASVQDTMKRLTNPPEGYEEAYQSLKEVYNAYNALIILVKNPTGTFNSYSSDYNKTDLDFLNRYKTAQIYI